jgi:hypothetical protein
MRWKVWLKGLVAAFVSGFSGSITSAFTATQLAPESFNMNGGLMLTLKLMVATGILQGFVGAMLYLKQSPVPPDDTADLPKFPPAAAALLLALALPAMAEASPVGVTIECAKTIEKLNGETNQIEQECGRRRIYFDLGIMFGGLAFKLERPRELLAGFNAGTGYGFRWCPDFWTLTPAFLAIDVFLNAGYLAREGGDAVRVGVLGAVSMMNFLGAGLGYQWVLGFGDSPDMKTPIGTVGVASSF